MKIPIRTPIAPPPVVTARPALRVPVAPPRPFQNVRRPYFARNTDALKCAVSWADAHTQQEISDAIAWLTQCLGKVYSLLGAGEYAKRFRIPGAYVSPCATLTEWAAVNDEHFEFVSYILHTLVRRMPDHEMAGASIYFHSPPQSMKRSSNPPDFVTCPLFDKR